MDSSRTGLSNLHQTMEGFAEQQDEDAAAFSFQPPHLAPAMHDQVYNDTSQQFGDGTTSLFPPAVHDHPQISPEEHLQFRRQPAAMTEHNYMQESLLSNQAQLELSIEDVRHFEARSQILERSQAGPTVPRQDHYTHPYNAAGFEQVAGADVSSIFYNDMRHTFGTEMIAYQTAQGFPFMNDDWNPYSTAPQAWHAQTAPQAPFPAYDHAQDLPTLINFNPAEPIAFGLSSHAALGSDSIAYNLEPSTPYYGVPFIGGSTQLPLLPADDTQLPFLPPESTQLHYLQPDNTQLPYIPNDNTQPFLRPDGTLRDEPSTTCEVGSGGNMAVDFIESPSVDDIDQSSRQPPSTRQLDMPSSSVAHQPIPPDLDIQRSKIPTVTSQRKAPSTKLNHKVAKSVNGKSSNRIHRPGLDNQFVHTTPAADREHKKGFGRTRKTSEISSWACLGCWIRRGKCAKSSGGPCEGCTNLLRWNSWRVHLQKFPCGPRERFSDIKIFTIPPVEPPPHMVIANDFENEPGSPPRKMLFRDFLMLNHIDMEEVALDLFKPFRNILDIIEPRHIRQVWPKSWNSFSYLSYSFSMVRWRRVILSLEPSMKDTLDAFEKILYWRLPQLLDSLDNLGTYKDKFSLVYIITILHEGICSMEPSGMVDILEKKRLLFVLEDRLSCLLHMIFPLGSTMKKLDREKLRRRAAMYNIHLNTSRLLPPEYHDCSPIHVDTIILGTHRNSPSSQWGSAMVVHSLNYDEPPKPPEGLFPLLLAYIPARFMAAFGLDIEKFGRIGQDINHPSHYHVNIACRAIQDIVNRYPLSLREALFSSTPVALSIGITAFSNILAAKSYSKGQKSGLLSLVILISTVVYDQFACFTGAEARTGKEIGFPEPFPGFSISICTWAEEHGGIQSLTDKYAKWMHEPERYVPSSNSTTATP
ncbi:hypothetical protein BDV95DRAFT_622906 [Massariosphaeria phaeospora]|uniref:Uncharacterized protein n=1 Tax=Massariosphaeria phaeospora TaxID=100035 RepID=A0A7C8M2A7_9PLEO|nr:hypothetical protein BDV95DRAFT_622906 [Massariosphaeria phaeospora]